MSWLTTQTRGLKITKTALAKHIGVSRPTLNKIEVNPGLLDMSQLQTMNRLGFTVPGSEIFKKKMYIPIVCTTCGGHGTVYQLKEQS